jgi:cytochrome c
VRGNRAPVVVASADQHVGAAPLKVKFSGDGSYDDDGDGLTYDWRFTDKRISSTEKSPEYTFEKPGVYSATLTVTDSKGKSAVSNIAIKVGNSMPVIAVNAGSNTTFFWDNASVNYQVDVTDKEDGSLKAGGIDPSKVKVYVDYLPQGKDMIEVFGHQTKDAEAPTAVHPGSLLINKSDCKACHAIDKKSVGPAYIDVAKKYQNDKEAINRLAKKVINGGGGVWGENVMSAHPQLSEADAKEMVGYVLSLANEKQQKVSMEPQGTFTANQHLGKGEEGSYVISAYYTDKGTKEVGPLMGRGLMLLRHPKVQAEDYDEAQGVNKGNFAGQAAVTNMGNNAFVSFKALDLKEINKLTFSYYANKTSGKLEVRLDNKNGKAISSLSLTPGTDNKWQEASTALAGVEGKHDVYIVYVADQGQQGNVNLNWIYFHNTNQAPARSQTISMK